MWYDDLNALAYCLFFARRIGDARPVFEAIGPYMDPILWSWVPGTTAGLSFRAARMRAVHS
jgi:hypothetical protein